MDEFSIINKYLKPLAIKNPYALNLSDDIYYDSKNGISISVDTYVEGVHFIDAFNPNKFLKKILRSSLSDLYCKGIKPTTYFLSFAFNKKIVKSSWFSKIKKILDSEQKKFDITLAGGDISKSSKLIITIIVLGYGQNKPVLRNGCKVNDDLYVTGNIGDSFIGLNVLKKKYNFGKFNSYFVKKYFEPELNTKFSKYLSQVATSSIDISDGLVQDLKNLFYDNNFGAEVNFNSLPVSNICKKLINKKKIKLKNFFSQGDDYQILFTSSPSLRNKIDHISTKTKTKISRIGVIKKKK